MKRIPKLIAVGPAESAMVCDTKGDDAAVRYEPKRNVMIVTNKNQCW